MMRSRGHSSRKPRGGSAVEFALLTLIWLPLLIGVLIIGTALVRALQTVQVARDAGHMFARNVDFSLPRNQELLARIGQDIGLKTSGGQGVVILSRITYIGREQCRAAGRADNSDPPDPVGCTNYQHFVFVQRTTIGNRGLRSSAFGDPTPSLLGDHDLISLLDRVTQTGARVDNFTLLPAPREDGSDGFQAGQDAYLVEAAFIAPKLPGSSGDGTVYIHAIF